MVDTMTYPLLGHAPIVEALISIEFSFQTPPSVEQVQQLGSTLADQFPIVENRLTQTVMFSFGQEAGAAGSPPSSDGINARSADKLYVAQILRDRITVSRLAPYVSWADLRAHVEPVWNAYRQALRPDRVVRLAVRYINRLELPDHPMDFGEYFRKPVEIPESLPQGVPSYFLKLVLPEPEQQLVALVQQVLEGPRQDGPSAIIFDIDAHKPVDLPADSEDVWKVLEALRAYKNRIFFENLTPTLIDKFR